MADSHESALVNSPHAARYTNKAIISSVLKFSDNIMRGSKNRKAPWFQGCTIRIVVDTCDIGSFGIELFTHVSPCKLGEGGGLETKVLKYFVEFGHIEGTDMIEYEIRKC